MNNEENKNLQTIVDRVPVVKQVARQHACNLLQNVDTQQENVYSMQYGTILSPYYESCGISFHDAQKLNAKVYSYFAEAAHHYRMLQLKLEEYEAKKIINQIYANNAGDKNKQIFETNLGGNGSQMPIMLQQLAAEFLYSNFVVYIRTVLTRDGIVYYARDSVRNRHIPVSKETLLYDFDDYLVDKIGEGAYNITNANKADLLNRQLRKVPIVGSVDCPELAKTNVAFANGYVDIQANEFNVASNTDRIFNLFSLEFAYDLEASNPDVFDAMLDDMFEGDNMKITLAYEIIGAIISNINTLKKIYVFQGKSNGGKTRLTEIIMRLLSVDDIITLTTVSDITDNKVDRDMRTCKLVTINEGADKRLSSKQVASLKAYADGSRGRQSTTFKIIVSTNYPITTDSFGGLDKGLFNRFAVLPFPKAMDNADEKVAAYEDVFFEQEKNSIAKKALLAFGAVLKKGGQFSGGFPINTCIEEAIDRNNIDKNITIINCLKKCFAVDDDLSEMEWINMDQVNDQLINNGFDRMDNAALGKLLKKAFDIELKSMMVSKDELQKKVYNIRKK